MGTLLTALRKLLPAFHFLNPRTAHTDKEDVKVPPKYYYYKREDKMVAEPNNNTPVASLPFRFFALKTVK